MNSAIEESWRDYQDVTISMDKIEEWAHEHGWKDGSEWILTDLLMDEKITEKTFKEYMNKIL